MSVIKSFFIAFSIYSKIPVPQFAWKEEDMRYTLCFFPWVGAVIGLCFLLWNRFAGVYGIPSTARAAVGAVLPLAISGGFHADGFMDTMDALHSYRDRERKLEILKDSHIGAFAVICFVMYELIYLGAVSMITEKEQILVLAAGFFLSRTLSGIGVVSLRCAKTNGMLYQFASEAHRRVVLTALYLQLVLCVGLMLAVSVKTGALACGARAYLRVLQTEELPRIWRYYRRSRGVFCDAVRGCDGGACGGGRADRLGMKHCGMTHQKG